MPKTMKEVLEEMANTRKAVLDYLGYIERNEPRLQQVLSNKVQEREEVSKREKALTTDIERIEKTLDISKTFKDVVKKVVNFESPYEIEPEIFLTTRDSLGNLSSNLSQVKTEYEGYLGKEVRREITFKKRKKSTKEEIEALGKRLVESLGSGPKESWDIITELHTTPSTFYNLARNLRESGVIENIPSAKDRRTSLYALKGSVPSIGPRSERTKTPESTKGPDEIKSGGITQPTKLRESPEKLTIPVNHSKETQSAKVEPAIQVASNSTNTEERLTITTTESKEKSSIAPSYSTAPTGKTSDTQTSGKIVRLNLEGILLPPNFGYSNSKDMPDEKKSSYKIYYDLVTSGKCTPDDKKTLDDCIKNLMKGGDVSVFYRTTAPINIKVRALLNEEYKLSMLRPSIPATSGNGR
jgi:hypothetical protein